MSSNIAQIIQVARREASLFKGRPFFWLAVAIISLIPSLYTALYIGAIWDPYGNMHRLPAGLAILDAGTDFRGASYNLGRQLADELNKKRSFTFIEYGGEKEAERAVRAGDVYFALVVPSNFSKDALRGAQPAYLTLVTSQGTSFVATLVAERLAGDVAEGLNHRLGVGRWDAVLSAGRDVRSTVIRLRDGAGEALAGSEKLREGLSRAATAGRELAEHEEKLANALTGIDTKKLVSSGRELHGDTAKLASGLPKHKLLDSLLGLPSATDLDKLATGAENYQSAIARLADGLDSAAAGALTLAAKERELAQGITTLEDGGKSLMKGLGALHGGLQEFASAMPAEDKSAEGLTESVVTRRNSLATVSSNGPAFAPYFMALSLWLGVLMTAFLFRLIVFPKSMDGKRKIAQVMGKGLIPFLISLTGAIFLSVTVQFAMGIHPVDRLGFYAVLFVTVITYSSIILSLVRIIGDAGKLLSVLFLVVQISSAGGAYPIELSPFFYRALSPYLPLTHVVHGLRAAMFGSYNGEWARCMLPMLPWIVISMALSVISSKRFKYVEDGDYGPALDLSFRK